MHLVVISFVKPRVSQTFNNATTRSSLSVETDKGRLAFGKRSFNNDRNFVVSTSVNFGRVDALIETRSLPKNKKSFYQIIYNLKNKKFFIIYFKDLNKNLS